MANTIKYQKSTGATVDQRRVDNIEHEVGKAVDRLNRAIDQQGNWNEVRVKSNYAAKPGDLILMDASGGASGFTLTFPDHTKCIGQWIVTKESAGSANPVVCRSVLGLQPFMDGSTSFTLTTPRASTWWRATSDGWHRL